MDKNTKRRAKQTYNPAVIFRLQKKYGLSTTFIGQSLRGERTSETSIKICEDYKQMNIEIKKTLQEL